jgi:glycosyltransferase involved in cell wall biosynthesis
MAALRVLYFGTYDRHYSRNRILIDGLRLAGADVAECHVPLWSDTDDKVRAASGGLLSTVWRVLCAYAALMRAYWPWRHSYDVMVLGYTGQIDVFPARVLTWLARRPLVLDVFISLYLTTFERGLPAQKLLRWIEMVAYQLPDLLLVETAEYQKWMVTTFRLQGRPFFSVPLGADSRRFASPPPRCPDGVFRVLYYGKYIPLHGVEYIIRAAGLLRAFPDIVFEMVGRGPTRPGAERLARELGLECISFIDWIEPDQLPEYVGRADVLLGVFADSVQSTCIVPNKVYEGLALGRPVVTGDSPTTRNRLRHRENAYLVERCNPQALADAILELRADSELRARLAANGRRLYETHYTPIVLGHQLLGRLIELVVNR